jgi:hypothetical protein
VTGVAGIWYGVGDMPYPPPAFSELQGIKLTLAARHVWLCLRLSGEAVRVSERALGKLIDLTQATVHKALNELIAAGLVQVLEAGSGPRPPLLLAVVQEKNASR